MIGLTEKSPMESPKENVIVKSARKRDRECSNWKKADLDFRRSSLSVTRQARQAASGLNAPI